MKTLVTYSSLTGNTKKVAAAIFEILAGEKEIMPIKEVANPADYDRVIVGYWVDKGGACTEAKNFMSQIENKTVGAFGTVGAYPDSKSGTLAISSVSEVFGIKNNLLTSFICQGAIDPRLIEKMRQMATSPDASHPLTPEREKLWVDAASHPDQQDLDNAKKAFAIFNA